ncbi:Uncharacterized protein {ECO:0000313/EMBL:CCF08597.1} [Pantoea ananatis]|nr:Uncharacterized protein {ECO:0000313/EMBL:CCF08597.1} [Pantoea ananatis]
MYQVISFKHISSVVSIDFSPSRQTDTFLRNLFHFSLNLFYLLPDNPHAAHLPH